METISSNRGLARAGNPRQLRTRILPVAALFYVVVVALLYCHLAIWPQEFKRGQVMPYTVFAPVTFTYEDSTKLEELTGFYGDEQRFSIFDSSKSEIAQARFASFSQELQQLRRQMAATGTEPPSGVEKLARKYDIPEIIISNLLSYQDSRLTQMLSEAQTRLIGEMKNPVTEDYVRSLKQQGNTGLTVDPQQVYAYFLLSNMLDYTPPDITEKRRVLAQMVVEKGDVVVAEGTTIDQRQLEQLQALKPHLLEQSLYRLLGLSLGLLALMTWWYLYFRRFGRHFYQASSFAQFGILFIGFLTIGLVIGRLPFHYFYYAVAFAVASLATLVALAYDPAFAPFFGLGLGLVLSVALNFGADLLLYTMAGALLPGVFLRQTGDRRIQVWFCFTLGLVNVILAGIVILVGVQTLHWEVFIIGAMAGILAGVLALGLLPMIETLTSQLTPGKLFELANQENELLRRLKREAHGTYIHSQLVADLAEEACKDIGADSLTAKVGALYHDIGKIKRPGFFAENIHDLNKNPHQGLPPETSVRILRDHVEDGLRMAEEARLPRELSKFIREHHGTYIIRYFYHRARHLHEEDPETYPEPDPSSFAYQGPLPASRESGVVMLADVTEAMMRSQTTVDPAEIRTLVDSIISDKLNEEQLINSGLTIGDLKKIKLAFCRTIAAQRHARVRYPDSWPTPIHFHSSNPDLGSNGNGHTVANPS